MGIMGGGRLPKLPKLRPDYIPFMGGLNTETTRWSVPPGELKSSQNYEHGIDNGYLDIVGYERSDGFPSPSSAGYWTLDVTITGEFSDGDAVTQLVSGATGVVIAVVTSVSPNYLVMTKVVGTFDATNDLQVSVSTEGTSLSVAVPSGASSSDLNGQYKNLAADNFRADISALPGAGDVLGITRLNDIDYGFRNNAGNTAADVFKSSAGGWVQVPLGFEMPFASGGTYIIEDGDTITGQTSTNTAVVTRVMLETGDWSAGTAAGRLIYASQSGPFTAAELLDVGANLDVATATADGTAITLLPDGRFEFDINQFGGEAGARKIYGCDTVNRGFEFDGTVFAPIVTGMTIDTPEHVIIHKNQLFFSFDGSAQHSGINTPFIWSPVFGAAELATGDFITGFMSEPGVQGGATLGIYNANTLHMLYGSSSADWELVRYRDEVGAFPYTVQQIGQTMFQDDHGITNLSTTLNYGNFQHSGLTRNIQTLFDQKKSLATASCIVREKNQYRIFYSDKTALYITLDGKKIKGIMPVKLDHVVTCIYSLEAGSGSEVIKFGSDDGFVYEMEKGTSFDGGAIEGFMFFHFVHSGMLRWIKKYLGIAIEAEGDGYAEFNFSYELAYGADFKPQPGTDVNVADFSESKWDLFTWDAFVWDGQTLAPTTNKLRGSGENIGLIITRSSDYYTPLKLSGALMRFTLRRLLRE